MSLDRGKRGGMRGTPEWRPGIAIADYIPSDQHGSHAHHFIQGIKDLTKPKKRKNNDSI